MTGRNVRARSSPGGRQFLDIVIDRGYHPDSIIALAGRPLRLTFRRHDGDACFERIVFSAPHIDRRIPVAGITIIDLPPQPTGEVRFTCGMGRYRGRIELVAEASPSFLGRARDRALRVASRARAALFAWVSGRSTEPT